MQPVLIVAVAVVAAFIFGVVFSQKIKDALAGVPASLRTELNTLEASVKGQVKAAQATVVADVKSKVVILAPVLQTSATPVTVAVAPAPTFVKV